MGRSGMERLGGKKQAKRADAQKFEGNSRRGRPRLRWEDFVKNVGDEWRTSANDGGNWKLLRENVLR